MSHLTQYHPIFFFCYKNCCDARRSISISPWCELKARCRCVCCYQHSSLVFRATRQSLYKGPVLYQQDCINAAVVLWVIRHLGIFTWRKIHMLVRAQSHIFCLQSDFFCIIIVKIVNRHITVEHANTLGLHQLAFFFFF